MMRDEIECAASKLAAVGAGLFVVGVGDEMPSLRVLAPVQIGPTAEPTPSPVPRGRTHGTGLRIASYAALARSGARAIGLFPWIESLSPATPMLPDATRRHAMSCACLHLCLVGPCLPHACSHCLCTGGGARTNRRTTRRAIEARSSRARPSIPITHRRRRWTTASCLGTSAALRAAGRAVGIRAPRRAPRRTIRPRNSSSSRAARSLFPRTRRVSRDTSRCRPIRRRRSSSTRSSPPTPPGAARPRSRPRVRRRRPRRAAARSSCLRVTLLRVSLRARVRRGMSRCHRIRRRRRSSTRLSDDVRATA